MVESQNLAQFQKSGAGGYLGPGSKANGKLIFEGSTILEGEVEGEILVHGHVLVGEHATIKGKLIATTVLIRGKVNGDVLADQKIEIQPPGTLLGDVTTQNLVMGDGAIFDGYCFTKREQREGKVLPLLRQGVKGERSEADSV